MGMLLKWYQTPKTRMRAVVVTLAVIVLAGVFFVINENQSNRLYYLETYEQKQQEYTRQLGNQVEMLVLAGTGEQELAEYFVNHAEVSGNSWMFVCRDSEVLFAKDQTTTERLGAFKEKDHFLEDIKGQNLITTTVEQEIKGTVYLTGTVTDEYYALTQGKVLQHEIYIYLVMGILIMLGVMAVICVTAKLNQVQRERHDISKTLQKQNRKLEESESRQILVTETGELAATESESGYYDEELIRMFLQKSDEQELMPMQLLFARIVMEERYYSRQEIFDVMEELKRFLHRSHVIGEIGKGIFVVLMYQTSYETAEDIAEKFTKQMESQNANQQIRLWIMEVKEGKTALEVYEEGLKKGE